MKKILLLAAFAGMLTSSAVASTYGDDKGKKECKKEGKSCAGEKKDGCSKGEKSCCKKKTENASTEKGSSEKK